MATDAGRAYVLTDLVGPVEAGDRVVLNTTAVELGLGTGGWHVVHWNLARDAWSRPGPGHIMKVRYTSLQVDTGAAEEDHPELPSTVPGLPVVACSLHSQVAVVAAVARHLRPEARIAYVMTDGAALPLALSDLAHDLRRTGILDATITAGHAFGGDLEAVAVPSALALAAHVVGADLAVVGMGPGVVGTASALGHDRGRGGGRRRRRRPDGRPRGAVLPRPRAPTPASGTAGSATTSVRSSIWPRPGPRCRCRTDLAGEVAGAAIVADPPDAAAVLAAAGVQVTTMGRGPDEDPTFFAAAAAAGRWAADAIG